jgi:hypothetical protein
MSWEGMVNCPNPWHTRTYHSTHARVCKFQCVTEAELTTARTIELSSAYVDGEHSLIISKTEMESIETLLSPASVGELRPIMGFMAYCRRSISGFSAFITPMDNLLKHDRP